MITIKKSYDNCARMDRSSICISCYIIFPHRRIPHPLHHPLLHHPLSFDGNVFNWQFRRETNESEKKKPKQTKDKNNKKQQTNKKNIGILRLSSQWKVSTLALYQHTGLWQYSRRAYVSEVSTPASWRRQVPAVWKTAGHTRPVHSRWGRAWVLQHTFI